MPVYKIAVPDGRTVTIEAGDEQTAMRGAQEWYVGQGKQPPQEPSALRSATDTLSDATAGLGQGLTFGFGDEIMSGMLTPFEMARGAMRGTDEGKGIGQRISDSYSRALDFNRGLDKQAQERSPIASTIGEVAGGVVSGGGLAKGGVTLLNAAKPTYTSMIGRGAAEGAAYGGLYGAGTGEDMEGRIDNAVKGAGVGALTGGALGVVGARQASNATKASIPSVKKLKDEADKFYKEVESAGVVLTPYKSDLIAKDVFGTLTSKGFNPGVHPKVEAALKHLDQYSGQPLPFTVLDQARQVFSDAAEDAGQSRLVGHAIKRLDEHMNNLSPVDVVVGDATKASGYIGLARDAWSRASRATKIEKAAQKAERRAMSTGSGGNSDNAIRQNIRGILDDEKKLRGFTKEEIDAMEKIVAGGPVQNLMRLVGKLSPAGNGLMAALGLGATIAHPMLAAAPIAGLAAKGVADATTRSSVAKLSEMIRNGGPAVLKQLTPAQQQTLDAMIAGGASLPELLGLNQPVGMTP
jgi:hypothetical protein